MNNYIHYTRTYTENLTYVPVKEDDTTHTYTEKVDIWSFFNISNQLRSLHVKAKFEEEKSEKENEASNLRPDNHIPFCSVLKGHLWKYTHFEN